ncbi:MAG: hypothetical protein RLZZ32_242 [Cyanobacteriota bacterium]
MVESRLIAGFDAGQTHTSCRLAWLTDSATLVPCGEGQGPGVSHLGAPGGPERFEAALLQSLQAAGLPAGRNLSAAGIGASGIEAGSSVERQGQALAARCLQLPSDRVWVSGDEVAALGGALGLAPGVLVISGTGCIALGRNGAGQTHRCSGWGWLLDGAGSAMDIGRDGLMLSVQMADGRLPESALRTQLWSALGIQSAQELKAKVVASDFGPAGFAQLAPLVDGQAAAGDPRAQAVIERSATALAQMVCTIQRKLQLQEPAICGVGGALSHLRTLRRAFETELHRLCPDAHWQEPAGDACDGALQQAAQAALRC